MSRRPAAAAQRPLFCAEGEAERLHAESAESAERTQDSYDTHDSIRTCPHRRDHARDATRRRAREPDARDDPRRDRRRPARDPRQRATPLARGRGGRQARPVRHRAGADDEDQREHRRLAAEQLQGPGAGQAPVGRQVRGRRGDGPVHRRRPRRHPHAHHRQLARAHRHRADLLDDRRQARRGADDRRHPRDHRKAGRPGRGLLHHPRRAAPRAPAAGRQAEDGHRLARRQPAGQVDGPPRPREPHVRGVRRDQRHLPTVRRDVLARRRPAPGLPGRRVRRRPVRRAGHAGRAGRAGPASPACR